MVDDLCGPLPYVVNATGTRHNQIVGQFECRLGHRFPTGHRTISIACVDQVWETPAMHACLREVIVTSLEFLLISDISAIACPPVPQVSHGSVNTSNALFGSYAHFICDPGYRFIEYNTSDVIVDCKDNGNWSLPISDCESIGIIYISSTVIS